MNTTHGGWKAGHTVTRRGLVRRGLGALAGVGVLACLPSSAGGVAAAATPRKGGTLIYATDGEATSLDPPYLGDGSSSTPASMIYNNLVKFSVNLDIQPDLATRWSVTGTTWLFTLRRGVMFHDGTAFDAHAVEAHFNRLLGPERP